MLQEETLTEEERVTAYQQVMAFLQDSFPLMKAALNRKNLEEFIKETVPEDNDTSIRPGTACQQE